MVDFDLVCAVMGVGNLVMMIVAYFVDADVVEFAVELFSPGDDSLVLLILKETVNVALISFLYSNGLYTLISMLSNSVAACIVQILHASNHGFQHFAPWHQSTHR